MGHLLFRSWGKAGVFSMLTSLFIFSFGHIYNLVGETVVLGISIGYLKLLAVYLLIYALFLWGLARIKALPSHFFLFGNIIMGVMFAINLVPVITFSIQRQNAVANSTTEVAPVSDTGMDAQPDIYYIVLDMYARNDIMQEVIGYDNSEFIDALKERGFYVPDCAYSNYESTGKTIISVLNYEYLDELDVEGNDETDTLTSGDNLVINNQIRKVLKSYGYQFVTGRGHDSQMDINNSDIYWNYFHDEGSGDNLDKQRFASLYFNTTVFRIFTEIYKDNPQKAAWLPYWLAVDRESNSYLSEATFWYYQNKYMFDSLEEIPQMSGDYFVYAHILSPHPPYVFRPDGSFNYPVDSSDEKVLYRETIEYLNKRVLEMIDTLQGESEVQPIIILQADHSIHGMTTGLDKHKILSAYYLPGELNTAPYATITPVNDFRLILKDYFDPTVELLPDMLYVNNEDSSDVLEAACDLDSK